MFQQVDMMGITFRNDINQFGNSRLNHNNEALCQQSFIIVILIKAQIKNLDFEDT